MKPYGNKYDSWKMKKDPWHGAPGVRKGRAPKKTARQAGRKEIADVRVRSQTLAS